MLLNHQNQAFVQILEVLKLHKICIFEGETRSGKTLTALSVAKKCGKSLFLTTKKALSSVKSDISKIDVNCEIMNYHSAHKVKKKVWDLVILDESHSSGISSFPKESKNFKVVKNLIQGSKNFLMMSGTLAIESKAQLFHELAVTGVGPWSCYQDFYAWWRASGHYKDGRLCGGYGIQGAIKNVGSNRPAWGEVVDYSQVDVQRVDGDIQNYFVRMEREGFQIQKSTLIEVKLESKGVSMLCSKIKRDRMIVVLDEDGEERECVYDAGIASVLQACHMVCGGTLKDSSGEAFTLHEKYGCDVKVKWMLDGFKEKSYAIHTAYIKERDFLKKRLRASNLPIFETYQDLREDGGPGIWVDSLESNAEGVDLAFLTGSQILYSLTWKGAKFSQICDRQLKFTREKVAKVAVPLLKGSVEEYIYEAVSNKKNFNGRLF